MTPPRVGRIERQSLADQARDLLRQAIFEGRIRPDEHLNIERLAADLGISRTPVREALKALEADGVIRILPKRGVVVERLSRDQIYDRYSVRALLEGRAAELACQAQPLGLVDALFANCEALAAVSESGDLQDLCHVKRLITLNREFHQAIIDASRSPTIVRFLSNLLMPVAVQVYHWRTAGAERRVTSDRFHRLVAEAFAARKPKEARRLMEQHVLEARDLLLEVGDEPDAERGGGQPRRK